MKNRVSIFNFSGDFLVRKNIKMFLKKTRNAVARHPMACQVLREL